jgi:hypothetical protein
MSRRRRWATLGASIGGASVIVGFVVVVWLASVLVAAWLGARKHRRGLLYGVFLSWVGVVLLLVLPPGHPHEDVSGTEWDETFQPTDDAFFKNMQYYSRQ